ncbi:MAG: hypothetical protein KAU41_08090, partial [Deltaproteobacteria bacterium]|nr:hypothetical protein [Deltaproteobacteria bacterium]
MPYSIEQPKNWRMKLGNAGRPASLSIMISCFLSLFLLHAELVQADIVVFPESVQVTATLGQTEEIERDIQIASDDVDGFTFTVTWDENWMEVSPLGEGFPILAITTHLTINPAGLSEGTHNGTIYFHIEYPAGSDNVTTKTVSVTLDIQAPPPPPPPPPPPSPLVKVVVSPGELQFYVTQEQLTNPDPITVWVNGFATDDGCATTTFSQEQANVEFAWIASKSDQWITLNGNPDSIVKNTHGNGSFTVGVDINQLLENQNIYGGNVTIYDGNVTVTLSDDAHTLPVRVYVNALRYAAEKSVATTDWLDLIMNVPVMEDISGALYVLAEHPSLAPGQVFAYRWDSVNGTRFDLFSQWGHPVAGAENLFYAEDVQNTPIAIPFSSDEGTGNPVIPYDPTDVAVSTSDHTPNIKALIPITFGGGLRLIGMEGDWIIRAIVGD